VKQYEPAIARETMIFLDLNQEAYVSGYGDAPVELAIVAAASLANHIIGRERLPVGLAVEASDGAAERVVRRFVLPPRPERGQLLAILEVLARVQPVYGGSFAGDIRRQSVSLPWGATVVAITGTPDEAVLETLLYLRRGGFAVSLVLVAPDSRDYPSAPAGVPVHLVHDEQDIEAWH
jgi:uncharacterized protein (DUF58 family)